MKVVVDLEYVMGHLRYGTKVWDVPEYREDEVRSLDEDELTSLALEVGMTEIDDYEINGWEAGSNKARIIESKPLDVVSVPTEKYKQMRRDQEELSALEAYGVDNWIGYGETDWQEIDENLENEFISQGLE